MKVRDLIETKDYPLIQFRITHPEIPEGVFAGVCKSEDGILISLDGDTWYDGDEVIAYEEFIHPKTKETCLDITIEGEWC